MSPLASPTLLPSAQLDSQIPDACLLEEFVSCQDEAAFTELVKRHGGLVRGVCRRILMDPAAADDAFQHTFFSLAQHAELLLKTVAPTASLGSWLYRVAVNASLQQKRKARSRRRTETQFAEDRPKLQSPSEPWNEVLPALDEEISALPGQYRSAVVKCHLEGKTQQDAAKELGITYATLRRRLKEARGMLRTKLSERGFAQHGCLLLPMLGHLAGSESVSAQTAVQVTQTVVTTTAAQAAASVTATSGGSLALGAKLLAANPLIKATLVGILVLGMAGTWWLVRNPSSVPVEAQPAAVTEADSTTIEEPAPAEEPIDQRQLLEEHFGYVLHNNQVLSPEFENAAKALIDLKGNRAKSIEADQLKLPELRNAQVSLGDVKVEAPLPKTMDILSQRDPSVLVQPVPKWDETTDPNRVLLAPTTRPQPAPDPLPVEKVMDFLKEEQERRSQFSVGPALPPSSQFFGSPATDSGKTLKVLSLP